MDETTALELAGRLAVPSDRLLWIVMTSLGQPSRAKPARPAAGGRHAFADALSDLMASGRLPRAGFALLQALDAALRRDGPLNDGSPGRERGRSEEHTSELQSLMRISYAGFCLKKKSTNLEKPYD